MLTQTEKTEVFAALHQPGNPLILFNIWDVGSAQAVEKAGAKALATGSFSVAHAQGFGDGEDIPLDLVIANAARIVASTLLPVSLDFEAGYGAAPETMRAVAATGIVGINMEDQIFGEADLRPIAEQCERIANAAQAGLFVNARTDLFLKAPVADHDQAMVDMALERARAYADSGARSFFVPMLLDLALLATLCERSPLPVNVMMNAQAPSQAVLAEIGIARISYGPGPWRRAMAWIEEQASAVFAD